VVETLAVVNQVSPIAGLAKPLLALAKVIWVLQEFRDYARTVPEGQWGIGIVAANAGSGDIRCGDPVIKLDAVS